MPAAKGKVELKVVLPQELKEQLDADATERGMDRSAWMTMVLQSSYDEQGHSQAVRLDQLIRDHVALREQVEQVAISLRELVEALQKAPTTPAKKVYPTPATWAETYPELYAPTPPAPEPAPIVVEAPATKKGWRPWRR
jgi:hypothetical protein